MAFDLSQRQRRWLDALLILSTIAVGFVVVGFVAQVLAVFGDLILIFLLAWLLAFILSPVVTRLSADIPFMPRVGAVVLVYGLLLALLVILAIVIAGALTASITQFIASVPTIRTEVPRLLASWQRSLAAFGLGQINLSALANAFLNNLNDYASQLAGPLQAIAVASLGALGNLLLVVVLSLYMVVDRDRILSFLFRLAPAAYNEEARLLEKSVAESFGGFLRGQAVIGIVYAAIVAATSAVFGLDYLPVTSVTAGLLMAIPFFGPFIAWLPPVLVAIFARPDATLPTLIAVGVGWLVVMNVLQPRLMARALRIHPIVVLSSVLIVLKVVGIGGVIFGIPIAAVISAFFFHYLARGRDTAPVVARAARRVEMREGRPVRIPREPGPGESNPLEPMPGPGNTLSRDAEADHDIEEEPLPASSTPTA